MTLKEKQDQWIAENPGMELPPDDFFETPETGKQVTVPIAPEAPPQNTSIIKRKDIKTMPDVMRALPAQLENIGFDPRRISVEIGFATQLVRKNPSLDKCNPQTIFDSVLYAARIGITLNPALQLCHLVPRGGECCLDMDYKGWLAVLRDYGVIKDAITNIVFSDEVFKRNAADGTIIHEPVDAENEVEHNKRKIVGAYNVFILKDGTRSAAEWIPAWELEKIAMVSPAGGSNFSPRKKWRDEMHKKSVIKRHAKKFRSMQTDERIAAMFENEDKNDKYRSAPDIINVTASEIVE